VNRGDKDERTFLFALIVVGWLAALVTGVLRR
jgi:hypothetical protein